MLTGDLVRARAQGKDLRPQLLKVGEQRRLDRAEELIALFTRAEAEGWSRGELRAACRDLEGSDPDHKVTKGLAKVMLDRCTFETICPGEPQALRMEVFARAAAGGPLARRPGPTGRRTARDVLAEVAAELPPPELPGFDAEGPDVDAQATPAPMEWTPEALGRALYADLKDEQMLTACKAPETPEALLHRYNVALVQALLLKGLDLTLRLRRPEAKRVRQLFRWLKFHQLMFRTERLDGDIVLTIDGPQSLLRQSTRYGRQLATFFPAVLLQPGEWWLEARIAWGRATRTGKRLVIDHTHGLQSHLRDTGTWVSRTERWFVERFEALDSGWTVQPGHLLELGDQQTLVPDLSFEKDGRTAHLDIVGYWRRGYLDKRIQATPEHVLLAVSKRLLGDKSKAARVVPERLADRVIAFAEVIPAREVLERIERVAR